MSGCFAIASPLGSMDASGTGIIETIVHTNASHSSVTHEFRATASKTSNLFTAFTWSDANTEGSTDASSGYAEYNLALDQAMFRDALAQLIIDASGGKLTSAASYATNTSGVPAQGSLAATYSLGVAFPNTRVVLDREIRKEVEVELDTNGVLEYLEGDSLGEFELAIDASGGAADMATKLAVKGALRNFFLQIPNRTSVLAEIDWSGNRLPVNEGDAVAFVFDVAPTVYITERNQTSGALQGTTVGSSNPLGTAVMGGADTVLNASVLTSGTRKIVYIIEVTA
jgi:hypothetical protein